MKKIKLLTPIIGFGAIASAATPLLVSCGSNGAITGDSLYIPTIEQAQEETKNTNEANVLYADHLKANPEIFVQDWMYDIAWKAKAIKLTQKYLELPEPTINIKAKFSNISVTPASHMSGTDEIKFYLLSYELEATIECDANGSYVEMPYKRETEGDVAGYCVEQLSLNFKTKMVNCPYCLEWTRETETVVQRSGWKNWFRSSKCEHAPNWSAQIHVDGLYIGTAENEYYEYKNQDYIFNAQHPLPLDNKATKAGYLWQTYDSLFGSVDYVYHFQNIH